MNQRGVETSPVGVVPDELALVDEDGVHGANGFGEHRHLVEKRKHLGLKGHGHVDARETKRPYAVYAGLKIPFLNQERNVAPVESQVVEGGIVDRGRERVVKRVAYDPNKSRASVYVHQALLSEGAARPPSRRGNRSSRLLQGLRPLHDPFH